MSTNFEAYNYEGFCRQGFRMTFANGCTVSVAFGSCNYCDQGKTTAEVWAWDKANEPVSVPGFSNGNVAGHLTPDQVLAYMNAVQQLEVNQ